MTNNVFMNRVAPKWTYIAIVLLAPFLFSCATQKACERRFPTNTHDSIIYKDRLHVVHDTVFLPSQEVTLEFDLEDTTINHKSEVKANGLTGSISIIKGKVKSTCKQDSLEKVIKRMAVEKSTEKVETKIITKTEYVSHWYDKPSYCLSILFLMIAAFSFGKWLVKKQL